MSTSASPWHNLESGQTLWEDLDPRGREAVVRHYAPNIKIIGLRLKAKLPRSVELGELLSAGSMGLVEALMKFNPGRGIKFETYAESRIKGAMLDELRRMDWFSRSLRSRIRQVEAAGRKLESELGGPARGADIAAASGLNQQEVESCLEIVQNQMCVSIEALSENLVSAKGSHQDNDPFQKTAFQELVDKVAGLIDELTPREKLVLSLYYGEELNMRETAEVMDITEGRVSQLHARPWESSGPCSGHSTASISKSACQGGGMAANPNMRILVVDDFSPCAGSSRTFCASSAITTSSRPTTAPPPGRP
jgi:RNA polymerase sigma factor for flagellar operon FliA